MKQIVEGFRSVLSEHQADKPHERDGDEYKHTKSLYYLHNSRYEFGFDAKKGTGLKQLDDPGYVDETPCPRCPECGWGIDCDLDVCGHCGSDKPAKWSDQ